MKGYGDGSKEILGWAVDQARSEFERLTDDWKTIDGKAQGTTAIAGILIAAAMVYVKSDIPVTKAEGTLVILVVGLLVVSIYYAVRCMRLQSVQSPMSAEYAMGMVQDLDLGNSKRRDLSAPFLAMQYQALKALKACNSEQALVIDDKAHVLRISQALLTCAAGVVVVLVFMTLGGAR